MMAQLTFRLQNIVDHDGLGVAATGMAIVFVALSMISAFIAILPRALDLFSRVLPEEGEHPHQGPTEPEEFDEGIAAAIGYALHMQSRREPPSS